jgi:hypothetical protein
MKLYMDLAQNYCELKSKSGFVVTSISSKWKQCTKSAHFTACIQMSLKENIKLAVSSFFQSAVLASYRQG